MGLFVASIGIDSNLGVHILFREIRMSEDRGYLLNEVEQARKPQGSDSV